MRRRAPTSRGSSVSISLSTFRVVAAYLPPPVGVTPPIRWGEEPYLRDIFGDSIRSIESRRRTMVFRFPSAEDNVAFFRNYYGPTLKTFEAVPPERRETLARELADLARRYDRNGGNGGPVAIEGEYLETVIVRA